jgi:hypothetical protein
MDAARTFTPAQLACIEEHRDINTDHDWWDMTYEGFMEDMEFAGLKVRMETQTCYVGKEKKTYQRPDVWFDLFRQGAHASFGLYSINLGDLARSRSLVEEVEAHWMNEHGERRLDTWRVPIIAFLTGFLGTFEKYQFHPASIAALDEVSFNVKADDFMSVECDDNGSADDTCAEFQRDVEGLDNWIRDRMRDIGEALHDVLEEECLYLGSDEAVWDTIEANDLFEEEDEDEEDDDDTA